MELITTISISIFWFVCITLLYVVEASCCSTCAPSLSNADSTCVPSLSNAEAATPYALRRVFQAELALWPVALRSSPSRDPGKKLWACWFNWSWAPVAPPGISHGFDQSNDAFWMEIVMIKHEILGFFCVCSLVIFRHLEHLQAAGPNVSQLLVTFAKASLHHWGFNIFNGPPKS